MDTAAGGVLDARQLREQAYHEEFAVRNRHLIDQPVELDVIRPAPRRHWNGYWAAYDHLLAIGVQGRRVLIPGCGFGEDAIRVARMGAEVWASDLSPDLLRIAERRAAAMGAAGIRFDVMPAEATGYAADSFDVVFFNNILHHVDIPRTLAETRRLLKPGGIVVVNELYTHSAIQRLRESRLVRDVLYPRMLKFIYGTDRPYITEDERKIDERELDLLLAALQPGGALSFFQLLTGRVVPGGWRRMARLDHVVLNHGPGRLLAGRFVLRGTIRK
jgi:2-polyprenyl-3-methyl-5-hydroxy-6-metoxy-1,4-benzoquinol methylase